jgi:hypothetical protein
MFEFSQYLGFTFFNHPYNGVLVNVFLVGFVSYWVGGATWEAIKEKRKAKKDNQFSLIDIKKDPFCESFYFFYGKISTGLNYGPI